MAQTGSDGPYRGVVTRAGNASIQVEADLPEGIASPGEMRRGWDGPYDVKIGDEVEIRYHWSPSRGLWSYRQAQEVTP